MTSKTDALYENAVYFKPIAAPGAKEELVHDQVEDYYGKVLEKSDDLKTNACTTSGRPPKHIIDALNNIHEDVVSKYYGCGLVVPDKLKGCKVLDLGCGSGRDCYIIAQLVGEEGEVYGVDMTDEQLNVAKSTIEWHKDKFGYKKPNTVFLKGFIEKLDDLNELEAGTFDVIVSNCVINLSPDKAAVLKSAYRLLKPGGELYFSDVYSSQRVPDHLRSDPVLWGECISGALYWNDFLRLSKECGFKDPRLVSDSKITIGNEILEGKIGHIGFYSATYRLWKLDQLEPDCEDYGQAVIYKGTVPKPTVPGKGGNSGNTEGDEGGMINFALDDHHVIPAGKVFPVCGNTWRMLHDTRFQDDFTFIGDFTAHYGIFDGCGKNIPYASAAADSGGGVGVGGGCC